MTKEKTPQLEHVFHENFQYTHANPYHDKLASFDKFVLRDLESEKYRNNWQNKIFNNAQSLEVEIGTGYGEFMHEHCSKNPQIRGTHK